MTFPDEALSCDGFLGGRLRIWQPRAGYRAATDPVFLAAAVAARPGQHVLELGCGAGVASLCLAARVPGLHHAGVERQPAYADLARRNGALNGIDWRVIEADIATPGLLRGESFDHVLANPPYYPAAGGTPARDAGREAALREETPLALWLDLGLRRLRPGGWLTLIQAADRLPDLLAPLQGRAGGITVLPLASRAGQPARRVIVQARKGARGPFRLLAPLVIHEGAAHGADGEDYTPPVRAILREGADLPMGA